MSFGDSGNAGGPGQPPWVAAPAAGEHGPVPRLGGWIAGTEQPHFWRKLPMVGYLVTRIIAEGSETKRISPQRTRRDAETKKRGRNMAGRKMTDQISRKGAKTQRKRDAR